MSVGCVITAVVPVSSSKLRASLADPGQLKILTGDWFQEARVQRHHHACLGSDLVRASIRRKKSSKGERRASGRAGPCSRGAQYMWTSRGPLGSSPSCPCYCVLLAEFHPSLGYGRWVASPKTRLSVEGGSQNFSPARRRTGSG